MICWCWAVKTGDCSQQSVANQCVCVYHMIKCPLVGPFVGRCIHGEQPWSATSVALRAPSRSAASWPKGIPGGPDGRHRSNPRRMATFYRGNLDETYETRIDFRAALLSTEPALGCLDSRCWYVFFDHVISVRGDQFAKLLRRTMKRHWLTFIFRMTTHMLTEPRLQTQRTFVSI